MKGRSFFAFLVKCARGRIYRWCRPTTASNVIDATRIGPLLSVALLLAIGSNVAGSAYGATEAATGWVHADEKTSETRRGARLEESRRKVRKENDVKSKAVEQFYAQQAASLARQYKETAGMVAREGGDSQPLLDAAAYFEGQSK